MMPARMKANGTFQRRKRRTVLFSQKISYDEPE